MEKESEVWLEIRKFYKDEFGIEEALVDVMGDIQILKLCATGASNEAISLFLDIGLTQVMETIMIHVGFSGWDNNLPFNPLLLYKYTMIDRPEIREMKHLGLSDEILARAYTVAELVYKLERILDEKWI
jgi:hypothetical protein